MKSGPDRRYTPEFRDAAVKQVIEGGRSVAAVARSLEMSNKSLANWVYRARKGQQLVKRAPAQPVSELEAELSRLRQSVGLDGVMLGRRGHCIPGPTITDVGRVNAGRARAATDEQHRQGRSRPLRSMAVEWSTSSGKTAASGPAVRPMTSS